MNARKKAVLVTFLFCFLVDANAGEKLASFVLSDEDKVYVYSMQDEISHRSYAKSCGNDCVEIKDVMVVPEKIAKDVGSVISDRYKIKVENGKALRIGGKGSTVILKEPLTTDGGSWSVDGVSVMNGKRKEYTLTCHVDEIGEQEVLENSTAVVAVVCGAKAEGVKIHTVARYAKNIGLIERAVKTATTGGDSYGAQSIKLTELIPR